MPRLKVGKPRKRRQRGQAPVKCGKCGVMVESKRQKRHPCNRASERTNCPIEGCKSLVQDVRLHLSRWHPDVSHKLTKKTKNQKTCQIYWVNLKKELLAKMPPPAAQFEQKCPHPLKKRLSLQIVSITDCTFSIFLHAIIVFFYDSRNPKKRFLNHIVPLIHAIIPKFVSTIIM